MEFVLQSFYQSQEKFLDYLGQVESFDDFVVGIAIGIKIKKPESEFLFLNILMKIWQQRVECRELFSLKYLNTLKNILSSNRNPNQEYPLHVFLVSLHKISEHLKTSNTVSTKFFSQNLEQAKQCYNFLLNHYKNSLEVIKILKLGKQNPTIFADSSLDFISIDEINDLIELIDIENINKACQTLGILCEKLKTSKKFVIYRFSVNAIIFLLEVKANEKEARVIFFYLFDKPEYFDEDFKEKVACAYYKCCTRLKIKIDDVMVKRIIGENKEIDEIKRKSADLVEAENKKVYEKEKIPQAKGIIGKDIEKKEDEKENKPNESKINADPTIEKIESPIKTSVKNSESVKKPEKNTESIKKPEKNTESIKKPEKNTENAQKDKPEPNKVPENNKEENKISETDKRILKILREARSIWDEGYQIDIAYFCNCFNSINYKNETNKLFEIIHKQFSSSKSNNYNLQYWKIMIQVFNKLSQIADKHKLELEKTLEKMRKEVNELENHKKSKKDQKKTDTPAESERQLNLKSNPELFEEISSLSQTITKLSQDAFDLTHKQALDIIMIRLIQQDMEKIKSSLGIISKTCTVKVIGSGSIGTCLKNTEIDLLLVDKNSLCEETLQRVFKTILKLNDFCYSLTMDSNLTFLFHINLQFTSEILGLIKKYCLINPKINELIMFMKLWARSNRLMCISGFQWTLLVISFMQKTEPPVVPSLQIKDHREKIVNGFDVWFDNDYNLPSQNCSTLGQLIYMMFMHLVIRGDEISDIKTGRIDKHLTKKFVALNPFTGDEIGLDLSYENQNVVDECCRKAMEALLNGESLDALMNLRKE
ncbi:hypothetical protein SteCoe_20341 [Stentor coeruleus]|uniref:PAP-associated domain-containing protein n=1 Tax=Stentor coeruleus TaxID=5963 RepID=A0A1R2BSD8_9CILI|nr:hypothetical protein SteCoe_20341 [Stentor coeruleus]